MDLSMDDQKLDELEGLLEQLTQLQQQLVEAAEAKKEAMRRLDHPQVEQAAAVEQDLAERVARVEAARRELLKGLPASTGAAAPSMAQIGDCVDEPRRSRLAELRGRVVELAQTIRHLNAVNRLVSCHCLEHFQSMLRVFTMGVRKAPVYTAGGVVRPMGGGGLLDQTA